MEFVSVENLHNFQQNTFLYQRINSTESTEKKFYYFEIITEVTNVINKFKLHSIPKGVGFAISSKEHTPALCVVLLAVLNHGGHICPVETNLTTKELRYLQECDANYFITHSDQNHSRTTSTIQLNIFGELYNVENIQQSHTKKYALPNLLYAIGTSGSTGVPKVVQVSYESIKPNIKELSDRLNITSNDLIFLGTPITFDPFFIEFFLALYNGAALLTTTTDVRLSPQRLLKVLFPKDRILRGATVLQMTPSIFRLFGSNEITNTILSESSSLRNLILGGERFPNTLELKSWLTSTVSTGAVRIFNIYGITELSCWSTIHEIVSKDLSQAQANEWIAIGKPIDNETILQLINSQGEIMEGPGEGELLLGSATRRCYIPQCDGKALSNDFVYRKTGDLIKRDEHGDMFYVGRINRTIKRLGKRLNLDSVHDKLETILRETNVQSHCLWDEENAKLICYIFLNNQNSVNKDRIRISIMEILTAHEKPDRIIFAQQMTLSKHGKIDSTTILKLYKERYTKLSPFDIFKNYLNEILGIEINVTNTKNETEMDEAKRHKTTANATFNEVGGTSFQALSLATEIGAMINNPQQQTKLLEMLLNQICTISDISNYLKTLNYSTRKSMKDNLQQANLQLKFKLTWCVDLVKCVDASPVIYDDRFVCVGSHASLLSTVDAISGKEHARLQLLQPIECKVEFVSSKIALVGCHDHNLYAFDFMKGEVIWNCNISGLIKAKPLHINGIIIVCSYAENANVVGICLQTRQIKWRKKIGTKGIFSSPIKLNDDNVLICTLDGCYTQMNSMDGNILWQQKCSSPIFSTPAIICATSKFVLAEVSGQIHVCDTLTGQKLKTFTAAGMIFSSITSTTVALNKMLILFGCYDQHVYCLEYNDDGSEISLNVLWKSFLNGKVYATPLVVKENSRLSYVLACTTKGSIALLDLKHGFLAASYELEAEVFSSPCCLKSENRIYIGCRDNFLYCLQIEAIA